MSSFNVKYNSIRHRGLYDRDITTVKRYGEHIHKIVYQPFKKSSGLVDDNHTAKNSVNDHKLLNNLSRAKSKVFELIMCNEFSYFCTFTISPDKYNRFDLSSYFRDFSKFIQNYNRYCDEQEKVAYVFVPEMHKNGAWHIHGVVKGIRTNDLYINEYGYLSWKKYEEKFGFISMSVIQDKNKAATYVSKYISKDVVGTITELGNHCYYASKGLKKAEVEYQGFAELRDGYSWDYEHPDGYCKILTIDDTKVSLKDVLKVPYDTKSSI